MKTRRQAAFTLIELLVVISIIGLLAAVALVAMNGARAKARDAQRIANKKQVVTAFHLYYASNNAWPPNEPHGNGASNGFSCLAPRSETCWSGFYDGSDALVTAMQPYMASFPTNNADAGNNAYNRILYTKYINSAVFGGTNSLPGAYIIWATERPMSGSDCPSYEAVQHLDKYYYCVEYLGP